jgi:hypothetical protein
MDGAECIANAEESFGRWLRSPLSRGSPQRDGNDHAEPGFLYLGDRESLTFIGEMAAGIAKHGPAFALWVRAMGNSPESIAQFEKVFLGEWKSATEFTQRLLDERDSREESEPDDGEGSRESLDLDAASWAQDLQRRGEIKVVRNPEGGVWIFRGW